MRVVLRFIEMLSAVWLVILKTVLSVHGESSRELTNILHFTNTVFTHVICALAYFAHPNF